MHIHLAEDSRANALPAIAFRKERGQRVAHVSGDSAGELMTAADNARHAAQRAGRGGIAAAGEAP